MEAYSSAQSLTVQEFIFLKLEVPHTLPCTLLFKSILSHLLLIVHLTFSFNYCLFVSESSNIISPLIDILLKLFRKMVNVNLPFHLTLLNVCFSNLKDVPSSKKGSIGFYLKQLPPPPSTPTSGSGKSVQVSWKMLKIIFADKKVLRHFCLYYYKFKLLNVWKFLDHRFYS